MEFDSTIVNLTSDLSSRSSILRLYCEEQFNFIYENAFKNQTVLEELSFGQFFIPFSCRFNSVMKKNKTPPITRWGFIMVRMTGVEPAHSRTGT